MAAFPPGFRFVAHKIGLPGFRDDPTAPAASAASTALGGDKPPAAPPPLPSANKSASDAVALAKSAAERQRKRSAAGTSLLTHPIQTAIDPAAALKPVSLLGY